jgi:hypothetical protein
MAAATGWLLHTTRAALTRLRQSGSAIERSNGADGARLYHLVSSGITATTGLA